MSLTLIIIINVALDGALLGGLAWVLSRPARLTPHVHSRLRRSPLRASVRAGALASAERSASRSQIAA